ncbi:MAG: hypothetical protein AAFQ12_14540 [Pseudomonadota bacterium]
MAKFQALATVTLEGFMAGDTTPDEARDALTDIIERMEKIR